MLLRLLYILVGLVDRWISPRRIVKYDGGFIFLGRNAVWRLGPDGVKEKISKP